MPLSSGQILNNRYRIVKLLGKGGFGAVYRAWDMTFAIPCAIKENVEVSPEAQRQFEREARLLRVLRHANLPQVSDFFTLPGQGQYLVMDYIEGEDLHMIVQKAGCGLPEAQALVWTLQVCGVLEYLHSRTPPIIHRDLKPANIRITSEGQAFLVDFGIAKQYDPARRTTIGARAATPGYAPIEQYKQSGTDARSDIYSLGACLYYMGTGQEPPECLDLITGGKLTPPRQINPALSRHVEQVILKAMQMLPEQRFQSAVEFAAAIRAPQPVTPAPAQPVSYASPVSVTAPAPIPFIPINQFNLTLAPGVEMIFVRVPAGKFWMGSNTNMDRKAGKDETPRHKVYLDEYWIGLHPVTNAQFRIFLRDSGYTWGRKIPRGKDQCPVVEVSWEDAQAFCQWINRRYGEKVRLPSEAEWEKAARGTDGRIYPWGNHAPDSSLVYFDQETGGPCPVGSYPAGASPYGALDMAGNVWEWVRDWYSDKYYAVSPSNNPTGPDTGKYRVLRGGSCEDEASLMRAAYRNWFGPDEYDEISGFRCAR